MEYLSLKFLHILDLISFSHLKLLLAKKQYCITKNRNCVIGERILKHLLFCVENDQRY